MRVWTGARLWIDGDGGATASNVDINGVFPDGVRASHAEPVEWKPKEPVEPDLYRTRTSISGKHGIEAQTNQDPRHVTKSSLDILFSSFVRSFVVTL